MYADNTAILFSADNDAELQAIIDTFVSKYAAWCTKNCIVINPNKSNYFTFNSNVSITINDHALSNPPYVKYLEVLFDNQLCWKYQVNHVTTLCSKRIGVFKRVLPYLPANISILYCNAFIKSCFSYCILYWFNNNRSGRNKLIKKVDNFIALLAHCSGLNFNDFIVKFLVQNVLSVHKIQSLLLMYEIFHNKLYIPYIHVTTNNTVHSHFTRSNCNLHIPQLSTVDKHNFV